MFKGLVRKTVPLVALGAGLVAFPAQWRKSNLSEKESRHTNNNVVEEIQALDEYKRLVANPQAKVSYSSQNIPQQHQSSHVGSGLLHGKDLFEIDPIFVSNESQGELTAFFHVGEKLISQDGGIHNGIVSTILDEALGLCAFPALPSGKGVTASLTIDFENQAAPNSTVMFKGKIIEQKGRKVVVNGTLETVAGSSEPTPIARARAVFVEPRWFKYFSWII